VVKAGEAVVGAEPAQDVEIVEVKVTPPGAWDWRAQGMTEADYAQLCAPSPMWDYSPETGGVPPGDGVAGIIRASPESHFVHWDSDSGSDENGTGMADDPVATEACARELAKGTGHWSDDWFQRYIEGFDVGAMRQGNLAQLVAKAEVRSMTTI